MKLVNLLFGIVLSVFLCGPVTSLQAASLSDANAVKGGTATKPVQPGAKDIGKPAVPQVTPRPTVTRQAPMLEIKRVYVFAKDDKLRVVICNTGGGLPPKAYLAGRLEVTLMGTATRWEWPLARINPQRDHFRTDRTFNTGKVLTESTRVMARIRGVESGKPWIGVLPEDENAAAKAATVFESAPKAKQTSAFRPIQKPSSAPGGVAVLGKPVSGRDPNTRAKAGAAPVPIQRSEMVPKGPAGSGRLMGVTDDQLLDDTVAQNLANPSVTLIAPNGGEEWGRGSMNEIVWQTFPGDRERRWEVAYTKGFEQRVVINDPFTYDAASGTYRLPWFIGNDMREGSGYAVRIQEVNGPRFDHSDLPFTIVEPRAGDLRLFVEAVYGLSPSHPQGFLRVSWRGDENVCSGNTVNMAIWSASGELIRRLEPIRGATCSGETRVYDLDGIHDRLSHEPFYVSVSMPPSCNGASTTLDYSAPRGIVQSPLGIISPSYGDDVIPGYPARIYWRDGNPTAPTTRNREFWLLASHTDRQSIPVDTIHCDERMGRYYIDWDAPYGLNRSSGDSDHSASQYAIQIQATDSGQESTGGNFNVYEHGLNIVAPVTGMVYYIGNYLPIQWQNTPGAQGFLYFQLEDAAMHRMRVDSRVNPARGGIEWQIPARVAPGQYQLIIERKMVRFGPEGVEGRIYIEGYGTFRSEAFEIRKPSLTLLRPTPQDGIVYPGDQQVPITWDQEGFGGSALGTKIRIELHRNFQLVDKIVDVKVHDGQYLWRAGRTASNPYGHIEITSPGHGETTDPATGTRFQILIQLEDDENVFDRSGYFEIQ